MCLLFNEAENILKHFGDYKNNNLADLIQLQSENYEDDNDIKLSVSPFCSHDVLVCQAKKGNFVLSLNSQSLNAKIIKLL